MNQLSTVRTDEAWIAELRGDHGLQPQEAAYRDLFALLHVRIYTFLRKRQPEVPGLRNHSLDQLAAFAEDLGQTALEKCHQKSFYDNFRGESLFTTYMTSIALNYVRQELRKKEWSFMAYSMTTAIDGEDQPADGRPHASENVDVAGARPEDAQALQEVWERVEHCIAQLPERWRTAFLLRIEEELPVSEIQARLDATSPQAVSNLVNRARSRLKECLAEHHWNVEEIWHLFD